MCIRDRSVIGASVVVKGTTNGTITDFDGKFTLQNVPDNGTIQVSLVLSLIHIYFSYFDINRTIHEKTTYSSFRIAVVTNILFSFRSYS